MGIFVLFLFSLLLLLSIPSVHNVYNLATMLIDNVIILESIFCFDYIELYTFLVCFAGREAEQTCICSSAKSSAFRSVLAYAIKAGLKWTERLKVPIPCSV